MTPHPTLSDWPDERRFSELVARHRSGFADGYVVSGVAPLDCSRFGPSTILPEECAPEGAAPVVSYDAGRILAESEREWPGLWWAVPAVVVLAIAASALWPMLAVPF